MWYEDEGRETGNETSGDIENAGRDETRENGGRRERDAWHTPSRAYEGERESEGERGRKESLKARGTSAFRGRASLR